MGLLQPNTRSSLSTYRSLINTYHEVRGRAISVFSWNDLPTLVESDLMETKAYSNGSVAVCYDRFLNRFILGSFIPLEYLDANKRQPSRIKLIAQGGIYEFDEFVILYDTASRIMLGPIIMEKCERLVETQRTIDINVHQQRTPRITVVPEDKLQSMKNLNAQIDNYEDNVVGVGDEFDIQQYTSILQPAPPIFNDLYQYKCQLYSEILNLLGITSVTQQNRERLIVDELRFSNGGTFQSRFNRYNPRTQFVKDFELKFGNYVDKIPSFVLYDEVIKGLPEQEQETSLEVPEDGGGEPSEL
jgi:hypothetical protein